MKRCISRKQVVLVILISVMWLSMTSTYLISQDHPIIQFFGNEILPSAPECRKNVTILFTMALGTLILLGQSKLDLVGEDASHILGGTIPPEIAFFTHLITLDIPEGYLVGQLPTTNSKLNHLQELNLSYNKLIGTVPTQIGNLTNLRCLDLSNNELTGTAPTQTGHLTHLFSLNLSDNKLTGDVPSKPNQLTNLARMHLSGNQFNGSIP